MTDPTPVTQADFEVQIARIESKGSYTLLDPGTHAYGKYQIEPANWKRWAPKALGTDPTLARANMTLAPLEWVPTPTPANQETVAAWKFAQLMRQLGDWRRVAASWRGGGSVGPHQPGDKNSAGAYIWTSGTLQYSNTVCHGYWAGGTFHATLGFPKTLRTTVLPPLPAVP